MRSRFLLLSSVAAAAATLLAFPGTASARDLVSVGVGARGGAGIVGLSKPGDTSVQTAAGAATDPSYPGFFGSTAGAGLSLDARLLGVVGLEADLFYAFGDKGSGDLTLGPTKYNITIGQPALHVPVLLKGVLPIGIVRPFAGFGPEFVVPGKSTATVDQPGIQTNIGARADGYTLLTLALGVEIKLPLPAVDLRIPIALRGSLNPGTSDKIGDRRDQTLSGTAIQSVTYKSEWQYQGMITAGASIWF